MPLFKYAIRALRLHLWLFAVLVGTLAASQSKQLTDEIDSETDDVGRLQALLQTLIEKDDSPYRTLRVYEYNAMWRGLERLAAMRPDAEEIKALDERFADGITRDEWYEFLLHFGTRDNKVSETNMQRANIEEVISYGYSFSGIPLDPAEMSVSDIGRMRIARQQANKLYREGQYEKAYPILLDLAKRGFRDAQSRLAYILFNGAGEVQKSNLRAMGWLGAASAQPTEPRFRVLFKKYMRQVPEHALPTVERVVTGYRDEYSHSEHWSCSIEHPYAMHHGSSIVKRVYCRYRIEAIANACTAGSMGGRCWVHKVNEDFTPESGRFDDQFSLEERLRSDREALCVSQPDNIACL